MEQREAAWRRRAIGQRRGWHAARGGERGGDLLQDHLELHLQIDPVVVERVLWVATLSRRVSRWTSHILFIYLF